MPPPPAPPGNPPAKIPQPKLKIVDNSVPKLIYFHYNPMEHSMYVSPFPQPIQTVAVSVAATTDHLSSIPTAKASHPIHHQLQLQQDQQQPSQPTISVNQKLSNPNDFLIKKDRIQSPKVCFVPPPQFETLEQKSLPPPQGSVMYPPPLLLQGTKPPSPSTPHPGTTITDPVQSSLLSSSSSSSSSSSTSSSSSSSPLISTAVNCSTTPNAIENIPTALGLGISPQTFRRLVSQKQQPQPQQQQQQQQHHQKPNLLHTHKGPRSPLLPTPCSPRLSSSGIPISVCSPMQNISTIETITETPISVHQQWDHNTVHNMHHQEQQQVQAVDNMHMQWSNNVDYRYTPRPQHWEGGAGGGPLPGAYEHHPAGGGGFMQSLPPHHHLMHRAPAQPQQPPPQMIPQNPYHQRLHHPQQNEHHQPPLNPQQQQHHLHHHSNMHHHQGTQPPPPNLNAHHLRHHRPLMPPVGGQHQQPQQHSFSPRMNHQYPGVAPAGLAPQFNRMGGKFFFRNNYFVKCMFICFIGIQRGSLLLILVLCRY